MTAYDVEIWTDGACSGNPGPGGWGVFLRYGTHQKELCGGAAQTTNNRMELQAPIEALNFLTRTCAVVLYTDSSYVCQGITTWLAGWKKKNWRTANGGAVKNVDLWQQLDEARQRHTVTFKWVKGHAGIDGNERADKLATQGMTPFLGLGK
jgi:ribonuclease HI